MSSINHYLESVGLSLVHSLWQGAILVFLVLLFLVILRNKSAQIRYKLVLGGLVLLPTLLILNLVHFWPEQAVENLSYQARDFSPITNTIPEATVSFNTNPQSNFTLLWIEENSSYIALAWLAGMVLFMLKVLGSFIWLKRMMNMATPMTSASINSLLTQIKAVLGIKTNIELKISSWVKSPIIVGIIRPTILLPIGLIEGLSIEEVEAILYHELSHFKRKDFVINIIINVLQIVFFYHPTYWWLTSQLDNEREYATDEMALQYSNKKLPMIKALAKVQAYSLNQPALGFAGNSKNQVFKRINNMMNSKQQPNWLSATFTIVLLLGAFVMMSMQDQKSVKEESNKQKEILVDLKPKVDSVYYGWLPIFHRDENDSMIWQKKNSMLMPFILRKQDTLAISQAILDLVQNRNALEIKYKTNGEIKSISKDGEKLDDETLAIYKLAWNQINELKTEVTDSKKAELDQMREKAALVMQRREELMRRLEEQKNLSEKDTIDNELQRLEAQYLQISEQYQAIAMEIRVELMRRLEEQKNLSEKVTINNQLQTLETQYQQISEQYQEIVKPGNKLDQTEVDQIEEYRAKLKTIEKELLDLRQADVYNKQIDKELQNREVIEEARYWEELNQKSDNRVALPGGEANEGILNVMLQPFVDKKSSTVYILDGIVLTDSDLLEKNIERLRSIEIVPDNTDVIKDFFGRDLEDKSTIIKLSTKTQGSAPRARFKLNDQFEIESIIVDYKELTGEEKEKALQDYRRYRELEYLERERIKLRTIIQSYENQGITKPEIQSQLKEAYGKADLLSERISDTRQFIRANNDLPRIQYNGVSIGHKMDSLSTNHLLGNPTQSVFYFTGENSKERFDLLISQFKQSGNVAIELDGKLKKNWTLEELDQKLDINNIEKLAFVKGETMYNFHSKKKLGESTALLRVSTKD